MRFSEEGITVLRAVLHHFGVNRQVVKTIEELGELCAELARVAGGNKPLSDASVIAELADAKIMIAQLELAIGPEQVADMVRIKMARVSELVQREEDLAAARAEKGAAK